MTRAVVIVNPAAGTKAARQRLLRAIDAHRDGVEIVETTSASQGRRAAAEAAAADAKCVIAAGGDGTIQSVASGLVACGDRADQRPALAFVPAGRGNDLASNYGTPRDPACALDLALTGTANARLDVGRVIVDGQQHFFVNALGIGYDAAVAEGAQRVALPGMAAYAVGILRTWIAKPWPWHLEAQVDALSMQEDVTFFSIGNGATTGGGFQLTPGAEPWDGALDYCVTGYLSRGSVLAFLPKVTKGTQGRDARVRTGRFESFRGRFEPPAPVHADGEVLSLAAREVSVDVMPGALRIIGPQAANC